MQLEPSIPVLRSLDEAEARAFYCSFLGFAVDWLHRFEPGLPLYMQLSRDHCVLHLSEHDGDGTTGSVIRVPTTDVHVLYDELLTKRCETTRPQIAEQPWGTDLSVVDPFGNRLIFTTAGTT